MWGGVEGSRLSSSQPMLGAANAWAAALRTARHRTPPPHHTRAHLRHGAQQHAVDHLARPLTRHQVAHDCKQARVNRALPHHLAARRAQPHTPCGNDKVVRGCGIRQRVGCPVFIVCVACSVCVRCLSPAARAAGAQRAPCPGVRSKRTCSRQRSRPSWNTCVLCCCVTYVRSMYCASARGGVRARTQGAKQQGSMSGGGTHAAA